MTVKLFSYKSERSPMLLKVLDLLRKRWPSTSFYTQIRTDWRTYIVAKTPDGRKSFVKRVPIRELQQ
jgi:hypothetical protein